MKLVRIKAFSINPHHYCEKILRFRGWALKSANLKRFELRKIDFKLNREFENASKNRFKSASKKFESHMTINLLAIDIIINSSRKFFTKILHHSSPRHEIACVPVFHPSQTFSLFQQDMGLTYDELSLFGRLRKVDRCGPYSMFTKLLNVWNNICPVDIAGKVR